MVSILEALHAVEHPLGAGLGHRELVHRPFDVASADGSDRN
jgi:hypothetical protein